MKSISLFLLMISAHFCVAQEISDSLKIDGYYRSFHFQKPTFVSKGASLVFVLHGSGGSGEGLMKQTANLLNSTRDENVIFVYADGYKHYWNECRKAASSLANKLDINEGKFFGEMIAWFKKKYGVDDSHVFVVGTSGGGHMAYKLGLTEPKKFRAIAAIIANLPDEDNMDCTEAKKPLPVLIVNGTADPLNKYEGGMMQSGTFIMGNVRSTDRTFNYWASLAGYHGVPMMTKLEDSDPSDGKTIERYTYKEKGLPEVTLLKVINGKHDYPNDIDVHVEAWNFFKRQLQPD
ncbi:MAG: poly(3-hydroxybutyrate) depolymerase [Chryseolinea sp.]